jgi:hypothetical protein
MGQDAAILGAVAELLASGYSLVVALVSDDGLPYATRGWGLTVLTTDPARIRLILSRDDADELKGRDNRAIAVTAAEPPTLKAVQLKGRIEVVEAATAEDQHEVVAYCDSFFGAVHAADGTERRFLDLLVPRGFVSCTVAIEDLYDQTPGPGAGFSLLGGGQ